MEKADQCESIERKTVTWYIYFHNATTRNWWNVFTRTDFEHVLGVSYSEYHDYYSMVDWNGHSVDVMCCDVDDLDVLNQRQQERGGCVVKFECPRVEYRKARTRWMPHNCASFIARCVHLDDRWIVTPWQLFNKLLKNGGEVI